MFVSAGFSACRRSLGTRQQTAYRSVALLVTQVSIGIASAVLLCSFWPGETLKAQDSTASSVPAFAEKVGLSIDPLIEKAITDSELSGAVIAIVHDDEVVFEKAYGWRQIVPDKIPMQTDSLFDLASLTKPIATATSVMHLIEQGELKIDDKIAMHIPEFGANGKENITVKDLLLHVGGLIPDNSLADYKGSRDEMVTKIYGLSTSYQPGTDFRYSDVGFQVLGELVHRKSGLNVHDYSQRHIFGPLQMKETTFNPAGDLRSRAVATEEREGRWMVGEVHDPRAYAMGGIAGHAGLFSTAADLSNYARMMLKNGEFGGTRILQESTVRSMTTPNRVPRGIRALGWDMRSGYSSNRGEAMSATAYGHGGFTGTAIWIDPELQLAVIFLSSRLHPDGKGTVNPLAGVVGSIAAKAVRQLNEKENSDVHEQAEVLCGIDVLARDQFKQLQGAKIGLITNQTGVDRNGLGTAQILHKAAGLELKAIFSPEHGLQGKLDQSNIADGIDPQTGLPIYSLYGANRAPTPQSLEGLDTLVFDIQDIGTRFYTYLSTMGNAMEVAQQRGMRFVVLDRPNPINGVDIEGPLLDEDIRSFVAYHNIPLRHGMTAGEIAKMLVAEKKWKLQLDVIEVEGWTRNLYLDQTDLFWLRPSPNMRTLNQALLYPGVGVIELTNISVGRGTDTPFERVGAPWLDARRVIKRLKSYELAGVTFLPEKYTPTSSKFENEECQGVQILITDRDRVEPIRVGLALAHAIRCEHPEQWQTSQLIKLLGSQAVVDAIIKEDSFEKVYQLASAQVEEFRLRRKPFLIYR